MVHKLLVVTLQRCVRFYERNVGQNSALSLNLPFYMDLADVLYSMSDSFLSYATLIFSIVGTFVGKHGLDESKQDSILSLLLPHNIAVFKAILL